MEVDQSEYGDANSSSRDSDMMAWAPSPPSSSSSTDEQHLYFFPEDMKMKIMSLLPTLDLVRFGSTSTHWRKRMYHHSLWPTIDLNLVGTIRGVSGDEILIRLLHRIANQGSSEQHNYLLRPECITDGKKKFNVTIQFDEKEKGACQSVKKIITTHNFNLSSFGVQYIAHTCPNIEVLLLPFAQQVSEHSFHRLFFACPKLRKLEMRDIFADYSQKMLKSLTDNLPHVGSLEITNVETAEPLIKLNRLKVLRMSNSRITVQNIAHIGHIERLEELHLAGCTHVPASIKSISSIASLRILNITGTGVGDVQIATLCTGFLCYLEELEMRNCLVTVASTISIAKGTFSASLRKLDIRGTRINTLDSLVGCKQLVQIIFKKQQLSYNEALWPPHTQLIGK